MTSFDLGAPVEDQVKWDVRVRTRTQLGNQVSSRVWTELYVQVGERTMDRVYLPVWAYLEWCVV